MNEVEIKVGQRWQYNNSGDIATIKKHIFNEPDHDVWGIQWKDGSRARWIADAIRAKFTLLTDEPEARKAEEIAAREAAFERTGVIRAAIIANIADTKVRSGIIPCPACKIGTVQYSQASNGHVHAACSTQGCASWME